MWYPAHIDGRTLVIIQPRPSVFGGYESVESGMLEYDGEVLHLVGAHGSRALLNAELESLQPVVPHSGIAVCHGFDFFLLRSVAAG